ncbi:MAG: DUF5671 domain-containing protein [bacterium]|nr:DUF5671 domain-containing protein [bacterium]
MDIPEQATKTTPGDVFRHLLAIITLYLSAVSFGMVVFSFIDRWFPDPLMFPAGANAGPLRWALSALVIVFPVYVWISWANARAAVREPALRSLRSRRWLYHFTVFAASVVIIGDLIALIYNFLSGDLTGRFILKMVAVLFIAIVIFAYYLWNLRRGTMASADPRMRLLVFGVMAVVVIAAIGGFVLAGSPFAERMRRFDERRVGDLQTIQWQVINYWQKKDRLPDTIDQLRDDISGFIPPGDPETGMPYEYRPLSSLQFELCATFTTEGRGVFDEPSLAPRAVPEKGYAPDSWAHGEGRTCFSRTIDPELYRIEKAVPR